MSEITSFLIEDVLSNSQMKIRKLKIETVQDITDHNESIISFSKAVKELLVKIKGFLNKNMYRNDKIIKVCDEYKHLIRDVYKICFDSPQALLQQWRSKKLALPILVGDCIAGMTDNFIIKMHKQLVQ